MREIKVPCRKVVGGEAIGKAIVSRQPISFFGGVDPKKGVVIEKDHELYGKTIRGKVLVFPYGKGSTVGSYVLFSLAKHHVAPVAIINLETETIVAAGCVLGNIPLVDKICETTFNKIQTYDLIKVFANEGFLVIEKD